MSNLRTHLIKQALVAAVLAAGSTSAMAYLPASNNDGDVTLHWGGATASTLSAMDLAVQAVCATDTHIMYVPANSGVDPKRPGNDWGVACRTSAAKTGLADGTRVLVVKRDRGGSGVGVGPVQTKSSDASEGGSGQILFLDVSTGTGANCPTAGTPGVNGAPAVSNPEGGLVPLQECAATYNVAKYTEMGTSDIEPDKFFGINTPVVGGTGLPFRSESDRAFADKSTLGILAFNTPVTLALRNKLQEAQFPLSSVCNPGNTSYAALTDDPNDRADATNGESEACMPSLTRSEIASLMTGTIANWNQLLNSSGTAIDPTSRPVQICRRVAGSGTQATINALMMGWPCDPGATIDIVNPRTHNGTTVIENSGSSDVDNCLHNFNGSANPYAIGVLSAEGRNINNTRGWRFIKVDGVAPTLRNIHAGDTYFWAQQSCQRRNNALPYNVDAGRPLDTIANKTELFLEMCDEAAPRGLNNPTALAGLDADAIYTWGRTGWLATPSAAHVADNVLNLARPVGMFTRDAFNRPVNICQVPLKATAGGNAARGAIVAPNPDWTP